MTSTLPLLEVADHIRGVTFSPADRRPAGSPGSLVCIRTANIQEELDLSNIIAVSKSVGAREAQFLRKGDILISSANSSHLVGKCCFVDELPYPALAGGFVAILRPCPTLANPRFLYHYLVSPRTQAMVRSFGRKTTNIANLDTKRLLQLPIPQPPLHEQERIASILDSADRVRRLHRSALALQDALTQATFSALVSEGNPDYAQWPLMRIEQLAAPHHSAMRTGPFGSALRHSEFVDQGIAVLGIDNAVQNRFAWDERRFIPLEKYAGLKRYTAFPGDVIVTIMGTTGRSAVIPDTIPLSITTKHLATITVNRSLIHPEYLSNALRWDSGVLRRLRSRNRGSIMDGLNLGLIRGLEVRVPPLPMQHRFAEAVTAIRVFGGLQESRLRESESLYRSLLHRAFEETL